MIRDQRDLFDDGAGVLRAVEAGFDRRRVLIVGDVMIDRHVRGSVSRISPEAPVPVVRYASASVTPGGCGNVAMNLAGLGLAVDLVSLVGDDPEAEHLRGLLRAEAIDTTGLIVDRLRPTTTKTRIMGGHQQMLRVDAELVAAASRSAEDALIDAIAARLGSAATVILSDYAKGVLTARVCAATIEAARAAGVPVFVDPKGTDWARYRGATTLTPNRGELALVAGCEVPTADAVARHGERVRRELGIGAMIVTLSEDGMLRVDADGAVHVAASAREVFDVSGAGDTAIATLAAAHATDVTPHDALVLANIAAGIVVGQVGTVPVRRDELLHELRQRRTPGSSVKIMARGEARTRVEIWRARGERIVFTNGCFDILHAGHVSYLEEARRLGHRLVVGLNSDASVRRLKGPERPINTESLRALVLSALASVDAVVVFEDDTPLDLILALRPDVLAKGADYREEDVVGAAEVRSRGGTVRLINLVEGLSTTRLVSRMASGGA
jgi:D-beta-D-heptose 7-phosphate kinase/D-beta-D-heptose 1-phosphate adenosyltransferase